MSVTIKYNGSNVATVEGGNTATLPVKSKKMATDIIVTVPEAESGASADDRVKYVTYMDRGAELIEYPVIEGDTARDPVAKG